MKEFTGDMELEDVDVEIADDISTVEDSDCPYCDVAMERVVENHSLFDGSATFHIVKLRCPECGKEFLDLDQAEKYDAYLTLDSMNISDLQDMRTETRA
ncbi:MAG: hypothetical protein ABEJ56_01080 [Candidatus Nanohaloarchaea archaeon]